MCGSERSRSLRSSGSSFYFSLSNHFVSFYFYHHFLSPFFLSSCDSPAVISNRCSSLDMMTHTRPLWFHTNRLGLCYGLPSFFSSVITFPATMSLCSLPHSFFLSYIHCFFSFFSLSACQALGLYCKYTHLHCYCWIVSVSSFFLNPFLLQTSSLNLSVHDLQPSGSGFSIVFIFLHLTSVLCERMYEAVKIWCQCPSWVIRSQVDS